MQQVTRRTALAIAMPTALLALAGCESTTTTARPGGNMTPADLDFVANAYNIITFDREECGLAQTEARSPEVRRLAAKLLAGANAFDAKLAPIAQSAGIAPPTVLRPDLRVRLLHVRVQRGLDFDQQFLEDQIASHQEILNRQEAMSGTPGNPQLAELMRQGTQELQVNLAELHRVQHQVMMGA